MCEMPSILNAHRKNLVEAHMSSKLSRRNFTSLMLGSGAALLSSPLANADEGAGPYVEKLGAEVIRLANGGTRGDKALQHKFAALFNRYISIPNISKFALGIHQQDLPASDKAMFYDLVANYAAALFVWYVEDFQGNNLDITKIAEQGKFTTVDATIKGGSLGGEKMRWRVRLKHIRFENFQPTACCHFPCGNFRQ